MQPSLPLDPRSAPAVEVRRSARRKKTLSAHRVGDVVVVDVPARLSRADEERMVPQLVARFLAKEGARRAPSGDAELRARAEALARRYLAGQVGHDVVPHDVRWVSNQQQRWGSCTPSTGEIRISDQVRDMPDWVVDYVLLHELTHLVEANHNARFWSLLAAYPRLERARGYLEGFAEARRLPTTEG